jgi:antitoxin PrlF
MATSTISCDGQTTIPMDIQRILNVKAGDKIQYFVEPDGRVSLLPRTLSVLELKSVLPKPAEPVSVAQMNAALRKRAAEDFSQGAS